MIKLEFNKEYELNKNNYIFTDKFPLKRILFDLSKENDKLKKKDDENRLYGDKIYFWYKVLSNKR